MLAFRLAEKSLRAPLVEGESGGITQRDGVGAGAAAGVTVKADLADSNRKASDIETKSNWELMANNKLISELCVKLKELTGTDPLAGRKSNQRLTSRT